MSKPVIPSRRALADTDDAWSHYTDVAGSQVAADFLDALEAAIARIGEDPGIGSPRWAHELSIAGLRSWRVKGFPYLIVYLAHDDAVDWVCLLHEAADIPAALGSSVQEGP